ncbi:MAG TPA: tRNA-uridine aminocarboxypropyltransferase [Stellaceae bacterium]|nr:tRNA-uridine aminocarboxypropyltransferase [Stellaceae bacterium]
MKQQDSGVKPADPAASFVAEQSANRVFVLVLQHPRERKEPRATAAAAAAQLRRARLVVGLSWPNLARALGRRAEPHRWGVLYLGSARPPAPTRHAPDRNGAIIVLGRDGEPVADPAPILKGIAGIVLLDGTWSEAKTLWWRNPWLLKLHRLVLNPAAPSRLGRLRREPRREALSTLEAIALVLREIEAGPETGDALLAVLDRLVSAQRRPAAPQLT